MNSSSDPGIDCTESYSQWGEDRLVWEFFGRRADGFFLEAGAFHPTQLSQTYLLEKKGWRGVLVEPMPDQIEAFAEKRPHSRLFRKALGTPEQTGRELTFIVPEGEMSLARLLATGEKPAANQRSLRVSLTTITEVLDEAKAPRLDYLSLDLEGHELAALQGLDFNRWRPGLVVIEDRVENLAQHKFLQQQDYQLVYRTGCNNWYVPKGTRFAPCTPWVRLKLFRKMVLAGPFRKLRAGMRRLRGR